MEVEGGRAVGKMMKVTWACLHSTMVPQTMFPILQVAANFIETNKKLGSNIQL